MVAPCLAAPFARSTPLIAPADWRASPPIWRTPRMDIAAASADGTNMSSPIGANAAAP